MVCRVQKRFDFGQVKWFEFCILDGIDLEEVIGSHRDLEDLDRGEIHTQ